jgi:hypothetical protein
MSQDQRDLVMLLVARSIDDVLAEPRPTERPAADDHQ